MILAAVHVAPWATAPLGAVVGLGLGWLWWWAGRDGVPHSRRIIRRASLLLGLALVPILVTGLSFVDPVVDPRGYAQTWTLALALLALVVLAALIDAGNSLRLHAMDERAVSREEADALVRSLARRLDRRADGPRAERRAAKGERGADAG